MKHFLRTPYWQLKLPTAINGLKCEIKICTCIHILSNVFRNFSLTVTAAKNDKSLNLVTKKLEKLSPKTSLHFSEMNYGD